MSSKNSGIVYSTDFGKMCPNCGSPADSCTCDSEIRYESDGFVRLRRETKGRKGKGVTLIAGISGTHGELKKFAKELKAKLSSGGTVKQGVIEIQGDHLEFLRNYLKEKGFQVKG